MNRVKKISNSSSDNSDRTDTSNDLDEASNISNDLNKSKMTYEIKKPLIKSDKKITKPLIQISNEKVINIQSKKISAVTCSKSISSQEHRTANKDDLVPQNSDTISTSNTCNAEIDLGKIYLLLIFNFCKSLPIYILLKF